MGTEQTIKLDTIINIFEAIKSVEDNKSLDFTIAYRLGRLADYCRSVIRTYERIQAKLKTESNEKIMALRGTWEEKTDDEKAAIGLEIKKINEKFMAMIDDLMETEESMKVPEFKLKDFENKNVPVKFFSLMGDIIKE